MPKYDCEVILNFENDVYKGRSKTWSSEHSRDMHQKKPSIVQNNKIYIISPMENHVFFLTDEERVILSKVTHNSRLYISGHGTDPGAARYEYGFIYANAHHKIPIESIAKFIADNCQNLKMPSGKGRKIKIALLACYAGKGRKGNLKHSLGSLLYSYLWHHHRIESIVSARVDAVNSYNKSVLGYESDKTFSKINFTLYQGKDVYYHEYDNSLYSFLNHAGLEVLLEASIKTSSAKKQNYLKSLMDSIGVCIDGVMNHCSTKEVFEAPFGSVAYSAQLKCDKEVVDGSAVYMNCLLQRLECNPADFMVLQSNILALLKQAALSEVINEYTTDGLSKWFGLTTHSRDVIDTLIKRVSTFTR